MAGDPASERPVPLSPPLRLLFFLHQNERGAEERKVPCPQALALVSGVIDRRSALSLGCFLLCLTLHQVWTPVPFLLIYMGSGPQGQLRNGMAGTLMAWKEEWGMGDSCFFFPPFRTFFNFLPGLRVPFQHEILEQAEVCPRKEMVFLVYSFGSCFIPFRELVCWGQLLFALPDMVHPSPQSSGREHQSQDKKKKKVPV